MFVIKIQIKHLSSKWHYILTFYCLVYSHLKILVAASYLYTSKLFFTHCCSVFSFYSISQYGIIIMCFCMRGSIRRICKSPITNITCKRFFPRMNSRVYFQRTRLCEFFPTRETSVRFLTSMRTHVFLQILLPGKLFITHCARYQIHTGMCAHVLLQISGGCEFFAAGSARKFNATVSLHVRLKLRRVIANAITNIAFVRLPAAVLAHVHCELRRVRKFLIAFLAGDFFAGVFALVHV